MKLIFIFLSVVSLNVFGSDMTCGKFFNGSLTNGHSYGGHFQSLLFEAAGRERIKLNQSVRGTDNDLYLVHELKKDSSDLELAKSFADVIREFEEVFYIGEFSQFFNISFFEQSDISKAPEDTAKFYNSCLMSIPCQSKYIEKGKEIIEFSRNEVKKNFFFEEIDINVHAFITEKFNLSDFTNECLNSDKVLN